MGIKMTIEARKENLEKVIDFINEELEAADCGMKEVMQIDIAVEELFINVCYYAYPGGTGTVDIDISIEEDPRRAVITFSDSGIPYDPLQKDDPDVTLSAEDREVGGLGIFMVKKSMDDMIYKYAGGRNHLTIIKNL